MDTDVAAVAQLVGDPRRAAFLVALLGGDELTAGELASHAGASSSLASAHLGRLLDGGLVVRERRGRHHLYRLASPDVAAALEALLAIAPRRAASTLREARRDEVIRHARTCYDHLAGRLGVALTDALAAEGVLRVRDGAFELTGPGARRLEGLGLDLDELRSRRRAFTRACLDWSERRPHVAGALGAGIADRLLALDWVRRIPNTRALRITEAGEARLRSEFGLDLAA